MAAATPDAIYREILAKLQAVALASDESLSEDRIVICPALSYQSDIVRVGVELIVPGDAEVENAESGVGLVRESFQVAVVQQLARDRFESWTSAVSDADRGIVRLINAIRGNGAPGTSATGLINFQTSSALSVLRFRGWTVMQQDPADPWNVAWVDRYDVDYEIDFE